MNEAVLIEIPEYAVLEKDAALVPTRSDVLGINVPEGSIRRPFPKGTPFLCPHKALAHLRKNPVNIVVVFPGNSECVGLCEEILMPSIKNNKRRTRRPYVGTMIVVTDSARLRREFTWADEICSTSEFDMTLARALNR